MTAADPIVIGQIDRQTAPLMVYEGAIYLHEGRQFSIEALDWENGIAMVQQAAVDYYTESSTSSEVNVIAEDCSEVAGDGSKSRALMDETLRGAGHHSIR